MNLTTENLNNLVISLDRLKTILENKEKIHKKIDVLYANGKEPHNSKILLKEDFTFELVLATCANADLYNMRMIDTGFTVNVQHMNDIALSEDRWQDRQQNGDITLYQYLGMSFCEKKGNRIRVSYPIKTGEYFLRTSEHHKWKNPERWEFVEHCIEILEKVSRGEPLEKLPYFE